MIVQRQRLCCCLPVPRQQDLSRGSVIVDDGLGQGTTGGRWGGGWGCLKSAGNQGRCRFRKGDVAYGGRGGAGGVEDVGGGGHRLLGGVTSGSSSARRCQYSSASPVASCAARSGSAAVTTSAPPRWLHSVKMAPIRHPRARRGVVPPAAGCASLPAPLAKRSHTITAADSAAAYGTAGAYGTGSRKGAEDFQNVQQQTEHSAPRALIHRCSGNGKPRSTRASGPRRPCAVRDGVRGSRRRAGR